MPDVVIRTALPDDREAVVDLIHELNIHEDGVSGDRRTDREAAATYHGDLQQRLARSSGRLIVASAEAELVGAMGWVIEEDPVFVRAEVRRYGLVTDLVVAQGWRGRGVGRMLLAEAERLTREAGLRRLVLAVLEGNEAALRAYEAFELKPYARILAKPVG
ncbi:MAG TPA: GNAT family N-acetyltransferase [Beijerinckiaceae bacterium]|jgi:ribosomal protein S18 acetylase RimI-like enzyme